MTTRKVAERQDSWAIIAPVAGLILKAAVNYEVRIDRVTFVSAARLPYRRKRFGIGVPLSTLRQPPSSLGAFFEKVETFALLRRTGVPEDIEPEFVRLAREEIAILALSQLGFRKRRNNAFPVLAQEKLFGSLDYLFLSTDGSRWKETSKTIGSFFELELDTRWKAFHRKFFFFDLLKILRRDVSVVKKGWRDDLYRAAVLAGQSQCSNDIPQAFLWNMIVLELLLTARDDRYREALPQRAKALLGWAIDWDVNRFEEQINNLYSKRCALVHQGIRDRITIGDLLFTDDLVFNLFSNIVRHPSTFPSKQALIEFSRKVEAEHLLGVKARVRPKTLHFFSRQYTPRDLSQL